MQKRLLVLLLGFALSAFGQRNYAVVTGSVTDPQHLPVVGAAIQVTAASTGAVLCKRAWARTRPSKWGIWAPAAFTCKDHT
jgi:hypothetical protein